jgi:hypothetical protein
MSGKFIAELLPSVSSPDRKFEDDGEVDTIVTRWLTPVDKSDTRGEKKRLLNLTANASILAGNCTEEIQSWIAVKLNVIGPIK